MRAELSPGEATAASMALGFDAKLEPYLRVVLCDWLTRPEVKGGRKIVVEVTVDNRPDRGVYVMQMNATVSLPKSVGESEDLVLSGGVFALKGQLELPFKGEG